MMKELYLNSYVVKQIEKTETEFMLEFSNASGALIRAGFLTLQGFSQFPKLNLLDVSRCKGPTPNALF